MENKGVLLTFHYRNVPMEKREPLVIRAKELISAAGFNIGNAHCALEVKVTLCREKTLTNTKTLRASLLWPGTREGPVSTF